MKKMYIEDFLKDAKPSDLIKRFNKKTKEYFDSEEFRQKEIKRFADVALLMNQVPGAEVF